MPWEEIEKLTPSKVDPNKVYLSSKKKPRPRGGKDDGSQRMYVLKIGPDLFKRLRWKADKEVKILWGTDNLKGHIRIEPVTTGPGWAVRRAEKTGVVTITTAALPADCAHADFDMVALEFTTKDLGMSSIGERALEIELPDGFFQKASAGAEKLAAGTRP